MTKYVESQLKKCMYADLSNYDESTCTYHIRRYSKPVFEVDKCYIVKISKSFLNNPNTVAAVNWNQGRSPRAECMKVWVSKMLGKMIYIDGIAYDLERNVDGDDMYSGWIPVDEMTQVAVL